jgi:hypothetical protein
MMPNLSRLISHTLSLPADACVWELSRYLASFYPDKYILETKDYDFDLEQYAADGRCSLHAHDDAHTQFEAIWPGNGEPATLEPRNAFLEVLWRGRRLHVLAVTYNDGCDNRRNYIIADDMPTARDFFTAVCEHSAVVEGQILVFRSGYWRKDAELLRQIESARLDDLILPPGMRETLVDDVEGFFASRDLYDSLGVAWKRGVLLLGPPGNGKTHALKAIIQRLKVPCLYVRSFNAPRTQPSQNIEQVFKRAREAAPCILVLEDLDSLVDRSYLAYFLNELDGFAANRGVLTVATTNHPDKLDPALLERPSRFDRKMTFDLPGADERRRFLANLDARRDEPMRLRPDDFDAVVAATEGFSFAYLKELFLSATMAWMHDRRPGEIGAVTLSLIGPLRAQMRSEPLPTRTEEDDED